MGSFRMFATRPDQRPALRHLATIRWGLLVAAVLLAVIGLATINSASAELSVSYAPRQTVWVGIGLAALLLAVSIDYDRLIALSPLIYGVTTLVLVLVLVVGQEAGGARSWLGIGALRGQPSEFAKLATAFFLAHYLAGTNQRHLSMGQIATTALIVLPPMVLIVLQRDLGSAVMFLPLAAGMLVVAGVRWRMMLAGVAVLIVVAGLVWNFAMLDYQRERVRSFVNPAGDPLGAGYQLRQSKIAVGSGRLTGRGYMQGTQSQLRFLPARHTDFIFAVLAEEWGFLGVITVMGLYALYLTNGAQVAARARDRAGIFLVVGLLSGVAFHVLYNTAMVVGLVPITGIPLPFLSYGGSFTLANFIGAGVIMGVDFRRYVNR